MIFSTSFSWAGLTTALIRQTTKACGALVHQLADCAAHVVLVDRQQDVALVVDALVDAHDAIVTGTSGSGRVARRQVRLLGFAQPVAVAARAASGSGGLEARGGDAAPRCGPLRSISALVPSVVA